jgi:putative glutamine amidotransferase
MIPPLVLIPCDNRLIGGQFYHALGRKYADAVRLAAECLPLITPTGGAGDYLPYLEMADGIMLTGSPANVHPSHFGQPLRDPQLPLDQERDSVTLPLVRLAVEHGIPLLAICRGHQELNVALGGTLHQAIHELPDKSDHREPAGVATDQQYGPAHEVEILAGSQLARIVGQSRIAVNSLHGQGIDVLAPGLVAEAVAPDHVIEAVRISAHPGFSLGLQWHPEWQVMDNPVSVRIFRAFGDACRAYRLGRKSGALPASLFSSAPSAPIPSPSVTRAA